MLIHRTERMYTQYTLIVHGTYGLSKQAGLDLVIFDLKSKQRNEMKCAVCVSSFSDADERSNAISMFMFISRIENSTGTMEFQVLHVHVHQEVDFSI